jgi:gamma-glutamylcyclotransferase (GGCT)/AIG2-like uncharacterized protein YtfP
MEERILVGVYDDLRQGGDSHPTFMSTANYIGTYYTEPEYSLYSLTRRYPGLKTEGSTSILLEIFEVDKETLKNIDYYCGCSDVDPYMNIYNRIEIDTPFGECIIYEYNRMIINKPMIDSGDWFRFRKEVKKNLKETNNKIY